MTEYRRGLSNNIITKFIDRFDICKYFPGYLRNKEILEISQCILMVQIITGENDVINGIDYCLNSIGNYIEYDQNQTDDYKDMNTEINDNKGQIIDINIITKQRTIEDSWS